MRKRSLSLSAVALGTLFSLSALPSCGDESDDDGAVAGTGGTSASGGRAASSGGEPGDGGTPAAEAGQGSGGSPTGMAGNAAGGDGPGGGDAGAGGSQVPGPAPDGGSVYAVECSGETAMCGVEYAHCLGIDLGEGDVGFACSNHCETVDDCSSAPTGAEAEPGCVQFTMQKRCMLVCYDQGTEYQCPDGMGCYVYQGSPIGYCLWM